MPNQSAAQPSQLDTRTKENPNRPEWNVRTLADLLQRPSVSSATPLLKTLVVTAPTGRIFMEDKQERFQSHEEREAQKLVRRIEKKQASQEAARETETKRTLEDYRTKVGS